MMATHPTITRMMQAAPLVIGHRGAQAYAPMNTLPAFVRAVEQGADGIELDVHLTKDGEVVVIHDETVDATTNGAGAIAEMTLAEVKQLDAGAWFHVAFADTRIPTLAEIFANFRNLTLINVEIKSTTSHTNGIEQAVAHCIRQHNAQSQVIVSSFNPFALRRFRDIMPEIPLGYLFHPQSQTHTLMKNVRYEAYHPLYTMVDENLMSQEIKYGRMVNVWTINDANEAQRLQRLGVHAFITDTPDVIVAALKG